MKDVTAVPVNKVRDRRVESFAVRTFQKQDGAVFHLGLPVPVGHFTQISAEPSLIDAAESLAYTYFLTCRVILTCLAFSRAAGLETTSEYLILLPFPRKGFLHGRSHLPPRTRSRDSADEVAKAMERVAKEFARVARVPGCRPGKAPVSLIRRRFADDIKGEVVQSLVPERVE